MNEEKVKIAQELKRRGFVVTETVDKGLLVEKETFWGHFSYDTGIGRDNSRMKWGRAILLMLFYGIGFFTSLFWLFDKHGMRKEVIGVTAGR